MAFTDYETEQLRKALLKETRRCAVTLGMKKTSVDQLTKAVGIAKGSFYKFYESKEMLFFAVLEGIHSELYNVADRALSENGGVPPSERTAKAVLAVCKRLSDPAILFSSKTTRSCSCKGFRNPSKGSIITTAKRTYVSCWRNTTSCLSAAFLLPPLQFGD